MKPTIFLVPLALGAALACACAKGSALESANDDAAGGAGGGGGGATSGGDTCAAMPCDANATCDDKSGSIVCTCADGYTGDGKTCEDLDECTAVMGICGEHAACANKPGGYDCTCEVGYEDKAGVCVPVGGCARDPCATGCTCDDAMGSPSCTCKLTQSSSQSIEPGDSASCNSMGLEHAENSYYRVFDLAAMGVTGPFTITGVEIAFESVKSNGGSQPATLNLHTLTGSLSTANLSLLTSTPITVFDAASLTVAPFPVAATAPPGSQLVVELYTPDGTGQGNLIFVGSNSLAETGPTYLRAPTCMFPEPVTTATIMFPNMHWVLNVKGTYTPG